MFPKVISRFGPVAIVGTIMTPRRGNTVEEAARPQAERPAMAV
jgi:hypothetical protein